MLLTVPKRRGPHRETARLVRRQRIQAEVAGNSVLLWFLQERQGRVYRLRTGSLGHRAVSCLSGTGF